MSPTPTVPSEASLQEMYRFRQALLDRGFAAEDEVAGCTAEEISHVVESAPFELPDDYLAFLEVLGRKGGTFFRGHSLYYPAPSYALEVAEDLSADSRENLSLAHKFFLGEKQGYIVYYLEEGRPEVFAYQEGHPEAQRLSGSFQSWLWEVLERSEAIREDIKRMEARTEAKRAQLRAEGKL